jgi:hypothetical protein
MISVNDMQGQYRRGRNGWGKAVSVSPGRFEPPALKSLAKFFASAIWILLVSSGFLLGAVVMEMAQLRLAEADRPQKQKRRASVKRAFSVLYTTLQNST